MLKLHLASCILSGPAQFCDDINSTHTARSQFSHVKFSRMAHACTLVRKLWNKPNGEKQNVMSVFFGPTRRSLCQSPVITNIWSLGKCLCCWLVCVQILCPSPHIHPLVQQRHEHGNYPKVSSKRFCRTVLCDVISRAARALWADVSLKCLFL